MSEFNWTAYERWGNLPAEGCKEQCNCEDCHTYHVDEELVDENAKSKVFQCCKDEVYFREVAHKAALEELVELREILTGPLPAEGFDNESKIIRAIDAIIKKAA